MACRVALLLLVVQVLSLFPHGEADFGMPPFLAPPFPQYGDGGFPRVNCSDLICGQGSCNSSSSSSQNGSSYSYSYNYSYSGSLCNCKQGWAPLFPGVQFSSCVLPNCTWNATKCNYNKPNHVRPDPGNTTALNDPCAWTDCGMGTCVPISNYTFRCDCKTGFKNLFNNTVFPCYDDCILTEDCKRVGASFSSNATVESPGAGAGGGGTTGAGDGGGATVSGKSLGLLLLMMCLTMA